MACPGKSMQVETDLWAIEATTSLILLDAAGAAAAKLEKQ